MAVDGAGHVEVDLHVVRGRDGLQAVELGDEVGVGFVTVLPGLGARREERVPGGRAPAVGDALPGALDELWVLGVEVIVHALALGLAMVLGRGRRAFSAAAAAFDGRGHFPPLFGPLCLLALLRLESLACLFVVCDACQAGLEGQHLSGLVHPSPRFVVR